MMKPIALIGLDEPEYLAIQSKIQRPIVWHPSLPNWKLIEGELWIESRIHGGRFICVEAVVYHAIFDDDYDFLCALAIWGGPCLPNAVGLMDCRLRIPCLARAIKVSNFGLAARGMLLSKASLQVSSQTVAKWGNRHCGENKALFTGDFAAQELTLFEPYFDGQAVRTVVMGKEIFQILLAGSGWLKSIHHTDSTFIPFNPILVEDTKKLATHFNLEMVGVDYIVEPNGMAHLLEVNHIPNVTIFEPIRLAFIELVIEWISELILNKSNS